MTSNSHPIIVEETYAAPNDVVWQAITDPERMRQWYFNTIKDFKPETGFETSFDVECEGTVYPHLWRVTDVIDREKIAYEWRYGGYPGDSTVVWELSTTPDGTRLKLTHTGGETFPQDVAVFSRESCEAGWKYFLQDRLQAYLEQHSL